MSRFGVTLLLALVSLTHADSEVCGNDEECSVKSSSLISRHTSKISETSGLNEQDTEQAEQKWWLTDMASDMIKGAMGYKTAADIKLETDAAEGIEIQKKADDLVEEKKKKKLAKKEAEAKKAKAKAEAEAKAKAEAEEKVRLEKVQKELAIQREKDAKEEAAEEQYIIEQETGIQQAADRAQGHIVEQAKEHLSKASDDAMAAFAEFEKDPTR